MNKTLKTVIASVMLISGCLFMTGASAALTESQISSILSLLSSFGADTTTINNVNASLRGQATTGSTVSGNNPAACSGITFSRSMSQGMSGTDVKCLQAILNLSADTQIAASGVGSAGNESLYFGSLTKAAVVKFQNKYASEVLTPIGLTAGTGYAGAKTVAKLNAMLTAGAGTGTDTGTGVVLPTAAGLTVALASDTPVATTIISDGATQAAGSQALVPYLKVNFSTPAGTSAKVTTLKIKRIGISSDTDTPNVYLYEGDTKLTEMTSLSAGVITFTNAAGLFTVSGSKTITVKADLYKDATAGKTIGLGIAAATDITTDASAVNGTFPINGNTMTVAVVSDFGSLSVASSSNAATVDPGITGYEAMRVTLQASNQKIKLYSIKFLQLGSIQKSDIANIALWNGSTQLGSTAASLASDGTVTFDLSAAPFEIPSGASRILSLKVDVVGGSTRQINFSLQRSTDVVAMDTNYGVYVTPYSSGTWGAGTATWVVLNSDACLVNAGNLLISRSTTSPSGNISYNSNNVTLAKYDVKAVGEDMKVSTISFRIAPGTVGSYTDLRNGRVLFDGVQIGTTQNQVATGSTYAIPVSFTVPVGQTKTLEIRADIVAYTAAAGAAALDLAQGDTIKATLTTGASNAQRMTSLGSVSFPTGNQDGNELIVITSAMTASKNGTIGDITSVYNVTDVTIGSYLLSAGAAEGVDVSKIRIEDATNTVNSTVAGTRALGTGFNNLKLFYGSTQIGATVVTNPGDTATQYYEFNPTPALSLAAGQTITLNLKADVNSSTTWVNAERTQISRVEGTGKVTTNSVVITSDTVNAAGQAITLTGAGALVGALDPSTPDAAIMAMGDTGKTLGIWKLTANNTEDLTVSKVMVFNNGGGAATTSSANVKNLKLYCGSDQFGSSVDALSPDTTPAWGGDDYANFGGATCVISKGSYKLITLKADVTPYADGASAGKYNEFYLRIPVTITGGIVDVITVRGAGAYAGTTASTSTVNRAYVYRTSLTAAIASHGASTNRIRQASDQVADLTLTGTASADVKFRAAIEAADEATTTWISARNVIDATTSVVATTAAQKIDGSYAISYVASTSAATTTWFGVDMGADKTLQNYAKVSFWIYPLNTASASDTVLFIASSTGTTAWQYHTASTTVAAASLVNNSWNYITVDLGTLTGTIDANSRLIGFAVPNKHTTYTYLVDNIRFYNDSIVINVGGNLSTLAATGTSWTINTTGGTQKGVGYYTPALAKVTIIPDSEISVGTTPQTFVLYTNTTNMMATDTTAVETLSLSSNLGNYTTAGDFRWWDQALAASTSVTWLNGASPISVSLGF